MCGAPELTRIELAVLGRPTAGHLAADQASAGHPAAADRASAARPAAADHPAADHLAGQASDLDSDSSSFLSNIGSPLRSLVFHGRSQFAANAFVPGFTLKQCVWNLCPHFEFPSATRRTDDGTLYASVAAWGADSDSGAHLAFWWSSLDAWSRQQSCPAREVARPVRVFDRSGRRFGPTLSTHIQFESTAASRAVAARVLPC